MTQKQALQRFIKTLHKTVQPPLRSQKDISSQDYDPLRSSQDSDSFRFLDLPRELRDQIYRELLVCTSDSPRHLGLCATILRVKRQIHEEASPILYGENCWIYGTTTLGNSVPDWADRLHHDLPFGGVPALTLNQRFRYSRTSTGFERRRWSWVIPAFLLVRAIDRSYGPNGTYSSRGYTSAMKIYKYSQQNAQDEERIYEFLRMFKGVETVEIKGFGSTSQSLELSQDLMAAFSVEGFFERIEAYKDRGDRRVAVGQYWDAKQTYWDGFHYVKIFRNDWQLQVGRNGLILALEEKAVDFLMAMADCNFHLRNLKEAHRALSTVFAYNPCKQRLTDVYCLLGRLHLAKNAISEAILCFLNVLHLQPGNDSADQELDTIEKGLVGEQRKDYPFTIPGADSLSLDEHWRSAHPGFPRDETSICLATMRKQSFGWVRHRDAGATPILWRDDEDFETSLYHALRLTGSMVLARDFQGNP